MTTIAIVFLLSLCVSLIAGCIFIDRQCPSRDDEERQARRDVEDMLHKANQETLNRRRVRG